MKILYIKATPKSSENSWTLKMSDFFLEEYKNKHPDHVVTELSLYSENLAFLDAADLKNMMLEDKGDFAKYVDQFLAHEKYVIAAPFWNLSFPAILKAYLDRIITVGKTFHYTAQGPQPLHPGKKVAFFMARGGFYSPGDVAHSMEHGLSYWNALSRFLGLDTAAFVLDGTELLKPEEVNAAFEAKKEEMQQKAFTF